MLRAATLLLPLLGLIGCSNQAAPGCRSDSQCQLGYVCDYWSGRCLSRRPGVPCEKPEDCRKGETCGSTGVCETGSCSVHACVAGFECEIVDGVFACVEERASDAGSGRARDGEADAAARSDSSRDSDATPSDAQAAADSDRG